MWKDQLLATSYPRKSDKIIAYGTAGFRTKADELPHVMYRMGLLAAVRARHVKAVVGVMITASHNPACDNGVKLVDPRGDMLSQEWEKIATNLANVPDPELAEAVNQVLTQFGIDVAVPALVFTGRDTRPSSEPLMQAVVSGVKAMGGEVRDYGVVSTPQLHYFVVAHNTGGKYGEPTEEGYFKKLSSAFIKFRGSNPNKENYTNNLVYDGANGVGAEKMEKMMSFLGDSLEVKVYNKGEGELNHMCGADIVKVSQRPPQNIPLEKLVRYATVDGDADRVVYFYYDEDNVFHLLDGDKIATLVAAFLQELVSSTGMSLNLGLVQTAYANGSSTRYISETLKIPVACVPTGIKHLHHKALEFDIGVYFEANGHGTVIFSDVALQKIQDAINSTSLTEDQRDAAVRLSELTDVINQTVGDAISDILLVESILHAKGWSVADWDKVYTDLPNRQLKVNVKDRNVITTTDAERVCVTPSVLQPEIEVQAAKHVHGRAFVRPSGTEDVVRVYAEANIQYAADMLAYEVAMLVYNLAGGVGDKPHRPRC